MFLRSVSKLPVALMLVAVLLMTTTPPVAGVERPNRLVAKALRDVDGLWISPWLWLTGFWTPKSESSLCEHGAHVDPNGCPKDSAGGSKHGAHVDPNGHPDFIPTDGNDLTSPFNPNI